MLLGMSASGSLLSYPSGTHLQMRSEHKAGRACTPGRLPRLWSRTADQCSRSEGSWIVRFAQAASPSSGATDIPRKPNYDFERRERERTKAAETAKKAQAKADRRAAEQGAPDADQADGS